MILERRFRIEMSELYGELGLCPEDMPNADPVMGMAAAHDLLEHEPGDDGSIAAELRALGAACWLRETIEPKYDMIDLYQHFAYEGFTIDKAPADTEILSQFDYFPNDTLDLLKSEYLSYGEKEERAAIADFMRYRWDFARWVSIGYRNAQERYSQIGRYETKQAFKRFEDAAQKFLNNAEEGQTLVLRFDIETGELSAEGGWADVELIDCDDCQGTCKDDEGDECPYCEGSGHQEIGGLEYVPV